MITSQKLTGSFVWFTLAPSVPSYWLWKCLKISLVKTCYVLCRLFYYFFKMSVQELKVLRELVFETLEKKGVLGKVQVSEGETAPLSWIVDLL